MSGKSFQAGKDYVRRYNSRNFKANRKQAITDGGAGNFHATRNGDLKPSIYLTKHAQERMTQRGVSHSDAIKGKAKSGAIISPNGAVVTVIPDTWADQQKKARVQSRSLHSGQQDQRKPSFRVDASKRGEHSTKIPEASSLPGGHSLKKLKVSYPGFILGPGHSNIKKFIARKYSGISYVSLKREICIWGMREKVDGLSRDLQALDQKAIDDFGPPIPEEETLVNGEVMKRIAVPKNTISYVFGAGKQKLKKMREEAGPNASITIVSADEMKGKTLCVWGKTDTVENLSKEISVAVKDAKGIEQQKAEKLRKVGKESQKEKMAQYKRDMEAFRRAGSKGNKKGRKNGKIQKTAKGGGNTTSTRGAPSKLANRVEESGSARNSASKPSKKKTKKKKKKKKNT